MFESPAMVPRILSAAPDSGGIPTTVVVILVVVGMALLVLFITAVLSIARSDRLSQNGKVVWFVICLILQFFGPLAWLLWGRHQQFDSSGPAGPRS